MKIRLNGTETETRASTVAMLLEELGFSGTGVAAGAAGAAGVAVAVNEAVVPRAVHASHALQENDRIEIIRAVQGG